MAFFDSTPRYDGAPTAAPNVCTDPLGWLLGLLSVPPPAYVPATPPTDGGVTGPTPTIPDPIARTCDPTAPIVFAPSGPVTIVLGADVRFAQE